MRNMRQQPDRGRDGRSATGRDSRENFATISAVLSRQAVVGFVLAERRYELSAEILYAAVRPDFRSTGIGTVVVARTCEWLIDAAFQLSPRSP